VSPDVVYVPAYSPVVVYGPGWYYPYWYYPYWYAPPPYPPPYGFVTFGVGFFWGFGCWSHCDWHHHVVCVDAAPFRNFHAQTSAAPVSPQFLAAAERADGQVVWTHDPSHRLGVAYRSLQIAQKFSGGSPSASLAPRYEPMPLRTIPLAPRTTPPTATMPPTSRTPPPIRSTPPIRPAPPMRPAPPVRPSPPVRPPPVRLESRTQSGRMRSHISGWELPGARGRGSPFGGSDEIVKGSRRTLARR
jgi:hypothetical protein